MRTQCRAIVTAVVVAAALRATRASAEDPFWPEPAETQPISQQLDELQARLDRLEAGQPDSLSCAEEYPCSACFGPSWSAGADLLWFKPHINQSDAFGVIADGAVGAVSFSHAFDGLSPRVWVGYTAPNGDGLRVRWWQIEDHDTRSVTADGRSFITAAAFSPSHAVGATFADLGVAGNIISARHVYRFWTLDAEVTSAFEVYSGSIVLCGGIRYAEMDQRYSVLESTPAGASLQGFTHSHDLQGLGPTLAAEVLQHVRQSLWSLYANTRGTLLFAETGQHIATFGPNLGLTDQRADADEVTCIGGFGIGLQYGGGLTRAARMAARFGYEFQVWTDAGGPNTSDGDVGFHGFTATLALRL